MESRHDLGLLTGYMDPQGQMRPPYADLCSRPPGTDANTLYHSRYLPSMPISTGSSFPFLGGMFTGSLPGPPTSPFRTPSTPGGNNIRQFWPPTPPPDGGYGRYSMNTNLFPLFGAPSPDNGAFLTQGLVSRLGSTTHLSPLIDHKERHPAYTGHMTMSSKELEELQEDSRLMKSHLDCLVPSSRPKSKTDNKHCCDKVNEDCCKLSPSCLTHDKDDLRNNSKLDNKNLNRHPTNKVHPCKIEVSHSPALKPDLLSPPIESPKSDVTSPSRHLKKSSHSPFIADSVPTPTLVSPFEESPQTRCSQCCVNIKDVGIATKLGASDGKEVRPNSHAPTVVSAVSSPVSTTINIVNSGSTQETAAIIEGKPCYEKVSSSSPVITVNDVSDKAPLFKCGKTPTESPVKSGVLKHVTAAVIPTAPKQTVHRDIHPETNCSSLGLEQLKGSTNTEQSSFIKEQNSFCTDNNVKM